MSRRYIPESEWVWQGHAGHFCAQRNCRFRMATRVGDYLISSVGDYVPKGASKRETVGAGDNDFFETFVFHAGETLECGCAEMADVLEIEGIRYGAAREAQEGHIAMCRKYAGLTAEEER